MKKLIPVTAVLILLAFGAFLLLDLGDAPDLLGNACEPNKAADTELAKVKKPKSIATEQTGQPDSTTPEVPTTDKEKPAEEANKLEPKLHVPDYGPLLQRGGGKVDFKLVDANGRECELKGKCWVNLYRRLGSFWRRDRAWINDRTNQIECYGHDGVGLEPGNYELEMQSSKWGSMRHSFSVSKGEIRSEQLISKNYLRRICLKFQDQYGNPIDWIRGSGPRVTTAYDRLPKVDRDSPNCNFLKDPPSRKKNNGSVGLGGGIGGGGGRLSDTRVQTDQGRWYVLVWAGTENTVTFDLTKSVWGVTSIVLKDKFLDSKWDLHTIVLDLPENHVELLVKYKVSRAVSHGNAIESASKLADRKELPYLDPIKTGQGRIVVTATPSSLIEKVVISNEVRDIVSDLRWVDGLWIADIEANKTYKLGIQYDKSNTEWLQSVFVSAGQIKSVLLDAIVPDPLISTVGLPETLKFAATSFSWSYSGLDHILVYPGMPIAGQEYHLENDSGQLSWGTLSSAKASDSFKEGFSLNSEARFISGDAVRLFEHSYVDNSNPVKAVVAKDPWSRISSGILLGRLVGDAEEGLSLTRGILQPFEDDEVSQRVLEKIKQSPNGRLSIDTTDSEYYGLTIEVIEESLEDESVDLLRELVGSENAKHFKAKEELHWFAKYGAWYKSDSKVYADDHGYIHTDMNLIPGKLYVLYLWSNSRDDMAPDKRIVFKAGKQCTDLGVIRLLSYR